jgi:hypothetical protein
MITTSMSKAFSISYKGDMYIYTLQIVLLFLNQHVCGMVDISH